MHAILFFPPFLRQSRDLPLKFRGCGIHAILLQEKTSVSVSLSLSGNPCLIEAIQWPEDLHRHHSLSLPPSVYPRKIPNSPLMAYPSFPARCQISIRTSKGSANGPPFPRQTIQPAFCKFALQPMALHLHFSPLPLPQRLPLPGLLLVDSLQQLPLLLFNLLQPLLRRRINSSRIDFSARSGLGKGRGSGVVETLGTGVCRRAAIVGAEGGAMRSWITAVIVRRWGRSVVGRWWRAAWP